MTDAIDAFCAHHFSFNGTCDDRQRMVRRQLRLLERHLARSPELCERKEFESFLVDQLDGGYHVNTVRKHRNAIRPFFKWAWRGKMIDGDRLMELFDVPNPRGATNSGTPRPYRRQEIVALWATLDERWPVAEARWLDRFERGVSPYRRVWMHAMHTQLEAIIRLALDCGLRHMEIFNADIADIHPDNAYVVVRNGKGGKSRDVPYTRAARAAVADWLELRAMLVKVFGQASDVPWVVVDARAGRQHMGRPMSATAFGSTVRSLGYELHRLRHTCATERLRAGMRLQNLSRFLGHGSVQQTLAYTKIVHDDIARDADRTEHNFERAVGRAA